MPQARQSAAKVVKTIVLIAIFRRLVWISDTFDAENLALPWHAAIVSGVSAPWLLLGKPVKPGRVMGAA
jgi:hypothetical protein